MRLNALFIGWMILLTSIYGNDLIQEGNLYCNATHNTVDTTIVYLNGIKNSLVEAEESRVKLEKILRDNGICDGQTCAVEKYYNKTDESFGLNDANELKYISKELEDKAIKDANIVLFNRILKDYERSGDYNSDRDSRIRLTLRHLEDVNDGDSSYIITEKYPNEKDINDTMNRLFGDSYRSKSNGKIIKPSSQFLKNYPLFLYTTLYRVNYKKSLIRYYLTNREFYKDDNDAKQAVTRTVEGLVTYLQERYMQGQKIIVVAHSQGNHMIELAYEILSQRYLHFKDSVRVVGVAVVAHTTPNGCYVTNTDDTAIDFGEDAWVGGAKPIDPNFEIAGLHVGIMHSFTKIYTNKGYTGTYQGSDCVGKVENTNLPDILVKLIKNQKDDAVTPHNQIQAHSILTASLRWERNYDDMDLYTKEPDGTIVYYDHKAGNYGSLDRDDTDYEGPEHYSLYGVSTANICSSIPNEGAVWEFGIHQYPNGGSKAIAHFQIKIGEDSVAHKSYSVDSWPSSNKWIGEIVFSPHYEGAEKIPYKITIKDQEELK